MPNLNIKISTIRLLSAILFLLLSSSVVGQVLNETYRVRIVLDSTRGRIDTENGPEPTWIADAANDTDNALNDLIIDTPGATYAGDKCYQLETVLNDDWNTDVDIVMAEIFGSSTGRFDWNVFSFERDGGALCPVLMDRTIIRGFIGELLIIPRPYHKQDKSYINQLPMHITL